LSGVYDNPKYYEIAFSFRDIPAEVDVFEECFKRFSQIPVKSVFELGCGNSPHMDELIKRGYQYNGLDLSKAMLEYSREKALRIGAEVNLIQADMIDFSLETKVDFVYVLLGSLAAKSTSELITHFNSVAKVLRKGGLYLLDWCVQYETPFEAEGGDSWEIERDGIKVKYTVSWKAINRVEQTFEETQILEVNDHGEELNAVEKGIKKAIYPQEFLCFVSGLKDFEFVGWWNNWDLRQPLEQTDKIDRPIALVRRI
jgi:SAM-dependent methyltransferase